MIKLGAKIAAIGVLAVKIKKIFAWCVDKWTKLSPTIKPIVEQVEKAAADGIITRQERKQIAMVAIANAEKMGIIKLNFFKRWLIEKIVDVVAERLPDIDVNKQAPALVSAAIEQVKNNK